ncbi:MAG: ParB/RepB/Spo0J family partition protein [Actinomycetales bacterium]
MSERRKGLGKGLGALIPSGPPAGTTEAAVSTMSRTRPVDVFFAGGGRREPAPRVPGEQDGAAGSTARQPHQGSATSLRQAAPEVTHRPAQTADADGSPAQLGAASDTTHSSARPAQSGAETAARPHDGADAPVDGETDLTAPEQPGDGATSTDVGRAGTADVAADPEEDLVAVPGATFEEIPLASIVANPRQPRQVFDEDELAELVHSIREVGVLQPVVVRPVSSGYELVMGERRWRACQQAGLDTVPAIVRQTPDSDLLRDALLENLHRAQLNPLEEAAAYDQLLKDFECSHEQLASRIGRSRPQISNTIRLLNLPALVQRRVAAGVLSAGHARALLGLGDPASMERLAQRIVAEGLSVRSTEEIVSLGLVDGQPRPRRNTRERPRDERLDSYAGRLSDRLETRVQIAMGARRGKLTVEFAGMEDLDRIMDLLAGHAEAGVGRVGE